MDNNETCERATSPLRLVTPAKRSQSITNHHSTPIETTIIERSPTRNTHERPTIVIRQNQSSSTGFHFFFVKN